MAPPKLPPPPHPLIPLVDRFGNDVLHYEYVTIGI